MKRSLYTCVLLAGIICLAALDVRAADPVVRAISEAESVLAIYTDHGRIYRPPRLILGIWPDGRIVWSEDRVRGGPPYRSGNIDAKRFASWLARLERIGALSEETSWVNIGIQSKFTRLLVRSGRRWLDMRSWHELQEADGEILARNLRGRSRTAVLKAESHDDLASRLLWTEIRLSAAELIPTAGALVAGEFRMQAGSASRIEAAPEPKD